MPATRVRRGLGTLLHDWPRFLRCVASRGGWVRMRNRADRLLFEPHGRGVQCDGDCTRRLHLCSVIPLTGRWLMRRALRQWPIRLAPSASSGGRASPSASPPVSFLIGHRGAARLPLLLLTLQSIAMQEGVDVECIVVEQDDEPLIRDCLPPWIRYIHTPLRQAASAYCRSWALNVAARAARGQVLILHDSDMLIPSRYAAEAWQLHLQGYEVMQLKRFIFYLDEASSQRVLAGAEPRCAAVENVVENMEGGASLAVSAAAYEAIGGMDDDFVGWGGEDNEFWDRCRTLKVWEYGYLPFVHLWHVSLAERRRDINPALSLLERKLSVSAHSRIQTLRDRGTGPDERDAFSRG